MNSEIKEESTDTNQVTVIIRSANERTTDLCYKLIREQKINEENIFFTRETPFSAALRKSYDIGISEAKLWTLCIDADLLLRPHSIRSLIEFAKLQQPNIFEIQGLIYDKFYDGPRQAGNHLYRTSLLHKSIKLIPEEGIDIRPEDYVLKKMAEQGYPKVKFNHVLGLHDFEQYYEDIYRKSFIQAYKHLNYAERMVSFWKEEIENDRDFEVALTAFADGIRNTQDVFIDKTQILYIEKFKQLNIDEKKSINVENFDLKTIEDEIKKNMGRSYENLDSVIISNKLSIKYLKGFQEKLNRYGVIKSLILSTGLFFLKIGRIMRNSVIR